MSLIDLATFTPTAEESMPTPRKVRPAEASVTKGERDAHLRLAAAMRDARLDAGLTQQELADRIGASQKYVSLAERGEKGTAGAGPYTFFEGVGTNYLRRIERALGLPLGTLATRAGVYQPLGDEGLRGYVRQFYTGPRRAYLEAMIDAYDREDRDMVEAMEADQP